MKIITKESKNTFKNKEGKEVNYINYFLVADNGKYLQIKCAFADDYDRLSMIANTDVAVLIHKKQSKQTYVNKVKKECHYYNYFAVCNGKSIQIRCAYPQDYDRLDMIAEYVG